jgi:hypothetical protein
VLHAAATAGAVDEAHERQAQVVRHPLREHHLLPDRGVGRPAAHREVVALEHRPAPVDPALPDDHVRGQEVRQLSVLVICALAGDGTGLVEAARVEQPLDALAHREPPRLVLARDALLAAHPPRKLLAPAELLELGLPTHGARL